MAASARADEAHQRAEVEVGSLRADLASEMRAGAALQERLEASADAFRKDLEDTVAAQEELASRAAAAAEERVRAVSAAAVASEQELAAAWAAEAAAAAEASRGELEDSAAASRHELVLSLASQAAAVTEAEVEAFQEELHSEERAHELAMAEMAASRQELEIAVASKAAVATEELIEDLRAEELARRQELEVAVLARATDERAAEAAACRAAASEEARAQAANLARLETLLADSQAQVKSLEAEVQRGQRLNKAQTKELQDAAVEALNRQLQIDELVEQVKDHDEQRARVHSVSVQIDMERASVVAQRMELDAVQALVREEQEMCSFREMEMNAVKLELRKEQKSAMVSISAAPAALEASEARISEMKTDASSRLLEIQGLQGRLTEQEAACAVKIREAETGRRVEVEALQSLLWREEERHYTQRQEIEDRSSKALEAANTAAGDLKANLALQQEVCRGQEAELHALRDQLTEAQATQEALNAELESFRAWEAGPDEASEQCRAQAEPLTWLGLLRSLWSHEDSSHSLYGWHSMMCCSRPHSKESRNGAACAPKGREEYLLCPPGPAHGGAAGTGEPLRG
uniref:Uncharacterized protein n=1 Tax=Pyrodinium bahamense TaxID=73915 RepID=A0A7S0AKY4_9DINO